MDEKKLRRVLNKFEELKVGWNRCGSEIVKTGAKEIS